MLRSLGWPATPSGKALERLHHTVRALVRRSGEPPLTKAAWLEDAANDAAIIAAALAVAAPPEDGRGVGG